MIKTILLSIVVVTPTVSTHALVIDYVQGVIVILGIAILCEKLKYVNGWSLFTLSLLRLIMLYGQESIKFLGLFSVLVEPLILVALVLLNPSDNP
jgi:hypothetical protein